jgi:hypothetical protein
MSLSENSKYQSSTPPLGAGGLGCSNILMIRPINFGFNEETANSNAFQNAEFGKANASNAQAVALKEFDAMVEKLRAVGVNVMVIEDTLEPRTPDSIFPNNWISFHDNGTIVIYPMQAENRRLERREDIIETIKNQFVVNTLVDLTFFEEDEMYLEGTGSMVFDRENEIAYACLSPRTHIEVLDEFSHEIGYEIVSFDAVDQNGKAIYHTNVLMCVGTEFVVICLDAIPKEKERKFVVKTIEESGKEIIEITLEQMNHFAGNMLEVTGDNTVKYLVMSNSAFNSLSNIQIEKLEKYCKIIHSDLSMIEGNGGGSARCMMAEVRLNRIE